jgi:hypothetical protein
VVVVREGHTEAGRDSLVAQDRYRILIWEAAAAAGSAGRFSTIEAC